MDMALFILSDSLANLGIQQFGIYEYIRVGNGDKAITAMRPGSDHDIIGTGQIKILSLVGPECSAANYDHIAFLFDAKICFSKLSTKLVHILCLEKSI